MGQYGTFLRGANPTNDVGIAEMNTIFPGVTSGNAAHIGVRVHPNWTGGTSVKSNTAAYIGRLYFTDQWSVVIGGASPYNQNTIPKTPNVQDPVWSQASGGGYSPIIEYVHLVQSRRCSCFDIELPASRRFTMTGPRVLCMFLFWQNNVYHHI